MPVNAGQPSCMRAMTKADVRNGLPRGALGILFLSAPTRVTRTVWPKAAPQRRRYAEIAIVALGARHLLEAGALLGYSRPALTRTVVGIDTLHAITMGALACLSPTYRRPGVVSALTATALAVLGGSALTSRKAATHRGKDE